MKKTRLMALFIAVLMLINIIPITAFAATSNDTLEISVSSKTAMPGETVQVEINLKNNPGIASLKFDVVYDDVLTLTDVSFNSAFGSYVTTPKPYTNPQTITMISPLSDVTTDGLFATLTFIVSETAKDDYKANVSIEYNDDDIYNGSYVNLDPNVIDGGVTIYHGVPGDVDGDFQVTTKDTILLFRYIAGWDVSIDSVALDVNGDNKINTKDAVELFRYAAGWDGITIYRGEICEHELNYTSVISATCSEDGAIEYWSCSLCDRIYSDANGKTEISLHDTVVPALGHTEVVDEAVDATYDNTGLTEGLHCSVCNTVLIAQQQTPMLDASYHSITYRNLKTAEYPSQTSYAEHSGLLELPTPSVNGYKFVGWYTASVGGTLIDYIPAGDTTDYILFAHWELETYTITYNDAPVHSNEKTYTVESEFVLSEPEWSGLAFSHWTDENGYVIKKINKGTTGNIELTANWRRYQNLATPSTNNNELIVVYDEDTERYHFVYDVGTIENVVLEDIGPGLQLHTKASDLSFEISNTVTIEDSIADSISKGISQSLSQSSEWTQTKEWAKSHSETEGWESKVSAEFEAKIKWAKIKAAVEHKQSGSETDESSWGESTSTGGSQESGSETSSSVSSTVSYKKEISNSVATNITISKDMPAGYYNYVRAGNIRVYAVVTYDPATKIYHLDTYSILDNMHAVTLYYRDVNELNSTIYETLAFDVDTAQIENYFATSFYNVKYDANGGEGTMPISVISNGNAQPLYSNQFTRTGYVFGGWLLNTASGQKIFQDKQEVTDLAANGETITLTAIWTPNVYTIVYDANTGYGSTATSSHKYDISSKLTSNGYAKTGYSFVEWNTCKDGSGTSYTDGASIINLATETGTTITLYAIWKINTYAITFITDGGTTVDQKEYNYKVLTTPPTSPTRDGYNFGGWVFDGTDGFVFGDAMPDRNIVATAIWNYKTVDYDSGESDKRIDASHEYDHDSFNIADLNVFIKEGYKLEFSISLYMKEEDEGYQEIYLRNSNGTNIAGNSEFAHGGSGTDGWGWEYFTFTVDGENCTNTMYLRYGAHGKNSDDWIRRRAIVTVRVIPE